jgi:hypothetical protein
MFILPTAATITKGGLNQTPNPWVWVVLVLEEAVAELLLLHDPVIQAEIDMFCIINPCD